MKEDIIKLLGANYNESDSDLLESLILDFSAIASDTSNLPSTDERLYPHIKKSVVSAYLSRGAEGLKSRNEGSISASYGDIIENLRNDLMRSGLRRCY